MRRGTILAVVALTVLAVGTVGCGDDGGEEVNVVLSEFIVEPDDASVEAGEITFVADNQGGETHELVVVKADSVDELPIDDDGAFDEDAFGEENVLGEVEDVESDEEKKLTLDLDAGTYVLLCNIVEEEESGEVENHFAEGMHAIFTVE